VAAAAAAAAAVGAVGTAGLQQGCYAMEAGGWVWHVCEHLLMPHALSKAAYDLFAYLPHTLLACSTAALVRRWSGRRRLSCTPSIVP
jgi:hypothetical protein